jgi:hypothetical protein
MENLLKDLGQKILSFVPPLLAPEKNPVLELAETQSGVMKVCYESGPLIRAIVEAVPMDERLEKAWNELVIVFDDAVTARIEQDQAAGLAKDFEARSVTIAVNRMDIGTFIHHFGRHPRSKPQPVHQSNARIWISTIYGPDGLTKFEE